jgi:hypothetical protein
MMRKPIVFLLAALLAAAVGAKEVRPVADSTTPPTTAATAPAPSPGSAPDSAVLERELQQLSWEQFKRVVVAVPKLKNGVDAFGPVGWEYVRANYRSYPWRRNIDRLDDTQKIQLAALIEQVKSGTAPANGAGS